MPNNNSLTKADLYALEQRLQERFQHLQGYIDERTLRWTGNPPGGFNMTGECVFASASCLALRPVANWYSDGKFKARKCSGIESETAKFDQ